MSIRVGPRRWPLTATSPDVDKGTAFNEERHLFIPSQDGHQEGSMAEQGWPGFLPRICPMFHTPVLFCLPLLHAQGGREGSPIDSPTPRGVVSCSSSSAEAGGVKNREVRGGETGNKFHYLRFFSSISIDESAENTANPIQTVSRWWPLIEKK